MKAPPMIAAYLQRRIDALDALLEHVPALTGLPALPNVVDRLHALLHGDVHDTELLDLIRAAPLLAGPLFRDVADATLHRELRGRVPFRRFARAVFPLLFPPREDLILPLGMRFFTDVDVVDGKPFDLERVMWRGPYGMPSHMIAYDSADVQPPPGWSVWCALDAVPEGAWTWMTDAYTVVRDARSETPDAFTSRAIFDGVMDVGASHYARLHDTDLGMADVTAAQAALQAHVLKVRRMQTRRPDVVTSAQPFVPYVWVEHDAMITSAFHIAAWCDTTEGRYLPMPADLLTGVHGVHDADVRSVLERFAADVCTSAAYAHVQSGPRGRIARLHMCTSEHEVHTYDVRTQQWVGEQDWLPHSLRGPMSARVQVSP